MRADKEWEEVSTTIERAVNDTSDKEELERERRKKGGRDVSFHQLPPTPGPPPQPLPSPTQTDAQDNSFRQVSSWCCGAAEGGAGVGGCRDREWCLW